MPTNKDKNAERKVRAQALKREGFSIIHIAAQIGVNQTTVRCWLDGEYYETRKRRINERRRKLSGSSSSRRVAKEEPEVSVLLQQVPADKRDLTGRLLGDPLPGRSAYDRGRTS